MKWSRKWQFVSFKLLHFQWTLFWSHRNWYCCSNWVYFKILNNFGHEASVVIFPLYKSCCVFILNPFSRELCMPGIPKWGFQLITLAVSIWQRWAGGSFKLGVIFFPVGCYKWLSALRQVVVVGSYICCAVQSTAAPRYWPWEPRQEILAARPQKLLLPVSTVNSNSVSRKCLGPITVQCLINRKRLELVGSIGCF